MGCWIMVNVCFINTVIYHHQHQNKGRGIPPQGGFPTGKLIRHTSVAPMQMSVPSPKQISTILGQRESLHHPRIKVLPVTILLMKLKKVNVSSKVI